MAELSEDEKQSLDEALSTLDDLYEATLKPDGGFRSEQMEAIAKLAEEAMGCVSGPGAGNLRRGSARLFGKKIGARSLGRADPDVAR